MVEMSFTLAVDCTACSRLSSRSNMIHIGNTPGGGLGALFPAGI